MRRLYKHSISRTAGRGISTSTLNMNQLAVVILKTERAIIVLVQTFMKKLLTILDIWSQ